MLDVLQDENDMEEDARAVLGGADDRNCTYNDSESGGYLKRQALYACVTCSVPNAPDFSPAGICLACSYACYNDHTLVELYTKRQFRCDCGNSKFPKSNRCRLRDDKDTINEKNEYNQNYRGVYCTCHRPYPDDEDPIPDAMIQCVICEDWLHRRHLKVNAGQPPRESTFGELICHLCSEKYHEKFLFAYHGFSVSNESITEISNDSIYISGNDETSSQNSNAPESHEKTITVQDERQSEVYKEEEEMEKKTVEKNTVEKNCLLKEENVQSLRLSKSKPLSLFMPLGWRYQLCKCSSCKKMYQELSLAFLIDVEDTVHHYVSKSASEKGSQYEGGLKALSDMDRKNQIEAIHGYTDMKSNLMEYLKEFAMNKRVVREEDIKEFFSADVRKQKDESDHSR